MLLSFTKEIITLQQSEDPEILGIEKLDSKNLGIEIEDSGIFGDSQILIYPQNAGDSRSRNAGTYADEFKTNFPKLEW